MTNIPVSAAALAALLCLAPGLASASPLLPTFMSVDVPDKTAGAVAPGTNIQIGVNSGTGDSRPTFTDDVYLNTLTFAGTSFTGTTNFKAAQSVTVLSGAGQVNVEWGDNDTGDDGDPNPMATLGQPDTVKETTDPTIQNAGLLEVFSSLSLSEMTDGEGGAAHSYEVIFSNGITDNADGADDVPEIVLFERGRNDSFALSLILGRTSEGLVLSDALSMSSATFAPLGMNIDTTEIGGGQQMGVAGFDLDAWGIDAGATVFGFVFEGSGADLSGVLASGQTDQFVPPLPEDPIAVMPLPAGAWLLMAGLGGLAALRRRKGASPTA
ncbi:MAG: exosortase-dependent surface protein XDP2 [Pseudomonadota bacterium]